MNVEVTRYDRLLISLAVAVLGAAALTARAHAQEAAPQIDRYGGEATRAAPVSYYPRENAAQAGLRGPQPLPGRVLSWAGKADSAPAVPPEAPVRLAYAPAPAYAPPPAFERAPPPAPPSAGVQRPSRAASKLAAPARRSRRHAGEAPASAPATAPDAPRPAAPAAVTSVPPPRAAPAYNSGGVRHYSVHREFGIAPDATPIPPQFFTATADLSAAAQADATPLPRTPSTQQANGVRNRVVAPADPS